ncbi:MAG: hypothetical protein IBJ03_01790 [Gemmatimonadaceae bacterium]|nr:hypothetical protein [Gemmatimonadaceae bacterium]
MRHLVQALLSTLNVELRVWGVAAVLGSSALAGSALLPGQVAQAQTFTRDFTVCFSSGVQSCTWLSLTTTAFFDNGNTRIGTAVDVYVKHNEGSAPDAAVMSALTGFYFAYAGGVVAPVSGADVSDESGLVAPLVLPEGDYSSPYPLNAGGWSQMARSSTTTSGTPTFDTYLSFTNALTAYDDVSGTTTSQYIGGCGVGAANGAIDPVYTTEMWTCGEGSYWFTTFTSAWFDANQINTVGVTTYGIFAGADYGVAAFCDRHLDTNTSVGDADGTFMNFGDVCSPGGEDPPPTTVPEPSSAGLMAVGFVCLARQASRRLRVA